MMQYGLYDGLDWGADRPMLKLPLSTLLVLGGMLNQFLGRSR